MFRKNVQEECLGRMFRKNVMKNLGRMFRKNVLEECLGRMFRKNV